MNPQILADSREKILAEARRLFVVQGYHGISMRQIAEAVQISKAGIYHHFKDKEELFIAVLKAYTVDLEHLVTRAYADGQNCRERLSLLIQRILAQPADQRAMIRLAHQEISQLSLSAHQSFGATHHHAFIDQIGAILQEGIAAGEIRPLDPTVAAWSLLGMMYPYFYPSHAVDLVLPDDLVNQIVMIYFDGIAVPVNHAA